MFDKIHWKLVFILLIFYIIAGIVIGIVLARYFPQYYFGWYPAVPGYFTVMGFILFRFMILCRKHCPQKIINVYMMMRGIKLLVTMMSMLLYTLYIGEKPFEFALVTLVFYFYYLIIETYIFIKFEKERISNESKK